MPRKKHRSEEIIAKRRSAEVELSQGHKLSAVCKKLEVTEQTYYRWRREYGGLQMDHAKRLRELEKENARMKRIIAHQVLDISILKEGSKGNF